jgi:hypothetical protein
VSNRGEKVLNMSGVMMMAMRRAEGEEVERLVDGEGRSQRSRDKRSRDKRKGRSCLTQWEIDGRDPGWEYRSNSTNAMMARVLAESGQGIDAQ